MSCILHFIYHCAVICEIISLRKNLDLDVFEKYSTKMENDIQSVIACFEMFFCTLMKVQIVLNVVVEKYLLKLKLSINQFTMIVDVQSSSSYLWLHT